MGTSSKMMRLDDWLQKHRTWAYVLLIVGLPSFFR